MTKKILTEKFVCKGGCGGGSNNAVYGLGFAGSLYYFIQHTTSVSDFFLGLVKSIVWPAVLVYKAFELLGF